MIYDPKISTCNPDSAKKVGVIVPIELNKFEYWEGYATFMNKKQDSVYPMFQPVLLMDERQLDKIKDGFSSLKSINKTKGLRGQVRDAVIEMVNCFIGDDEGDYKNREIGEVLYCLSMFKIKKRYWDWKIDDIDDNTAGIHPDDIKAMRDDLIETSEILKDIRRLSNPYQAKFKHIGKGGTVTLFYWIPTDVFPHQPKIDDVTNSWF